MTEFTKTVEFRAAFDKRDPDPSKDYGIHGVDMTFYLVKDNRAIQFMLYTGWHLPHVREEGKRKGWKNKPLPADLGYHSPVPMYEDDLPITDDCHVIEGPCYYDGSSLAADDVFEILVSEGSDGVWTRLEEEWNYRFGDVT